MLTTNFNRCNGHKWGKNGGRILYLHYQKRSILMTKLLFLPFLLLISSGSFAQATLFSETFESGSVGWVASGNLTANEWVMFTCAGNGGTSAGLNSMYVSPFGGTGSGCGVGQIQQFAYGNAPASAVHAMIMSHTVNATCASSPQPFRR